MAIENQHLKADVIEAGEFPQLVQRYNIRAVPKTVINEFIEVEGMQPEKLFLGHVMRALGS